ncbi:uncharacterized protein LOC111135814 isoform X3 [Crassostrea virginica]
MEAPPDGAVMSTAKFLAANGAHQGSTAGLRSFRKAGSLQRWTPPHTEHTKEGGCRWSAQRGPTAGRRCRWKHNGDPPPDDAADGSTTGTHRRTTLQMEAQRGPTTGWSRDV